MPIIPYFEQTVKVADAPAPVLDTNRRPTVNADATVRGVARLAQAGQAPLINPDPFVAQDRALVNLGQGIAQAGGVLQHLANKQKEAKDYTDVTAAQSSLRDAATSFEEWKLKNPDPSTWKDGWVKHYGAAQKAALENPQLSPEARQKITEAAGLFGRTSAINVSLDAAKTTFARARGTATVAADNAFQSGNVAEGEAILAGAVEQGYLMGDDAHRLLKAGKAVAERTNDKVVYDQNYGAILADADGWLAANKQNANGLDPQMHNSLEAQAYQQKRLNTAAVAGQFADAMATDGAIKSEADIETMLAGQRPAMVAEAKADWQKLQTQAVKDYNASLPGLLANTGKLLAALDGVDPKSPTAEGDRIRAEYLIKSLVPEGYRDELIKRLDGKFNPPKTPPNPTVNSYGTEQISQWFKDGRFGEITRPAVEGEKGYVPPTETFRFFGPNDVTPSPDNKDVVDPSKRDAAMATRGRVEMDWQDWQKRNPSAGIEEAQKALAGIVRGKLSAGDVSALLNSPVPVIAPPAAGGRTALDVLSPPGPPEPVKPPGPRGDKLPLPQGEADMGGVPPVYADEVSLFPPSL